MFGSDSPFGNSSPLGGGPSPLEVWGYGAQPEPDPIRQLQDFIPPTPASPPMSWEQPGFQEPVAFISGLPGQDGNDTHLLSAMRVAGLDPQAGSITYENPNGALGGLTGLSGDDLVFLAHKHLFREGGFGTDRMPGS